MVPASASPRDVDIAAAGGRLGCLPPRKSLAAFPLEHEVERVLAQPWPARWEPSGVTRSLYLDMAEAIVRAIAPWQDDAGSIVDCVTGEEWGQATPRYACPGAYLLNQGRLADLRGSVERAMTNACERLAAGTAPSPDFWMRELAAAYHSFRTQAEPPALLDRWAEALRRVEPEEHYLQVRPDGHNLHELHNWTVYAAAGEAIRESCDLVTKDSPPISGMAFFEKYMPAQLAHFTEYGMYRDPNDPFTYDLTTRLQFMTALRCGYRGSIGGELEELLRRGALTQLFYLSPLGLVPYGGRSSQFHFQEAIVCALCESEASRYAAHNPVLAGAFKRQARLSALALRPWLLDMKPFRYARNRFPIEDNWGSDSYAHYSCYGLTAASFLTLAAEYADDTVAEEPCPAERGGFVLHLDEAFHKVFATAGGYHVEIDTRADFHHDATGLGRVHRAGQPYLLGWHAPLTGTPSFKLPKASWPRMNASFSTFWKAQDSVFYLAALSDGLRHEVEQRRRDADEVDFSVHYQWQGHRVTESFVLNPTGMRFTSAVSCSDGPLQAMGVQIPVLITDGCQSAEIFDDGAAGQACWRWQGEECRVRWESAGVSVKWEETPQANRNGLFRLLLLETSEPTLTVEVSLGEPG